MIKTRNYLIMCLFFFALITTVQAEPIKLYNITVQTNQTWEFNTPYKITVLTQNMSGSLIDVTEVDILLIEPQSILNRSASSTIREDVGVYSRTFAINKTNLTTIHFNITVIDRGKSVSNTVEVELESGNGFSKLWETTKKYFTNTKEKFFKNAEMYWIVGGIAFFAILTIVLFLDMIFRRKRKETET